MPGPNRYGPGGKLLPKKPKKYVSGKGWSPLTPSQQASPSFDTGGTTSAAERVARQKRTRQRLDSTRKRIRRSSRPTTKTESGVSSGPTQIAAITAPADAAVALGSAVAGIFKGDDKPKPRKPKDHPLAKKAKRKERRIESRITKTQKQLTKSDNRKWWGRPISPTPARNKKLQRRQARYQETLEQQKRKTREVKRRVALAKEWGGPNNRPEFKGPKTQKEVNKWANRVAPELMAQPVVGRENYKAPKAKEGGRTPQEVMRALGEDRAVSRTNLTVARGQWKKQGGKPSEKTVITALNQALPRDRRGPTVNELIRNPDLLDAAAVAASRRSYRLAKKEGINEAKPHRNPWELSDAQAPENETPEQKFKREQQVLKGLLRHRPGKAIEAIDAFSQQRIRKELRMGGEEGAVSEMLSVGSVKKVGKDVGKFLDHLGAANDPIDFIGRLGQGPGKPNMAGAYLEVFADDSSDTPDYESKTSDYAQIAMNIGALKALATIGKGGAAAISTAAAQEVGETGTKLGLLGGTFKAAASTRPGGLFVKGLDVLRKPAVQTARKSVAGGTLLAAGADSAIGGLTDHESQVNTIIKGTIQGNVPKAALTTAKSFLMAFTAPFTVAGNLLLSGRRLVELGADSSLGLRGIDSGEADMDIDYALNPLDRMVTEWWKEIEYMADTYATGSVEDIRDATTNDFGYIALMGAAWMMRPALTGTASSLADTKMAKYLAATPPSRKIAYMLAQSRRKIGETNVAQGLRNFKDTQTSIMRTGVATGLAENRYNSLVNPIQGLRRKFNKAAGGRLTSRSRSGKQMILDLEAEAKMVNDVPLTPETGAAWFATTGRNPETFTQRDLLELSRSMDSKAGERAIVDMLREYPEMWRGSGRPATLFREMVATISENDKMLTGMREVMNPRKSTTQSPRIDTQDTDIERQRAEVLNSEAALLGVEPGPRPLTEIEAKKEARKEELGERRTARDKADERINEVQANLGVTRAEAEARWRYNAALREDEANGRTEYELANSLSDQVERTEIDLIDANAAARDVERDIDQLDIQVRDLERDLNRELPEAARREVQKEYDARRKDLADRKKALEEKQTRIATLTRKKERKLRELLTARERAERLVTGKTREAGPEMRAVYEAIDELREAKVGRYAIQTRIDQLIDRLYGRLTPRQKAELDILMGNDPDMDVLTRAEQQGSTMVRIVAEQQDKLVFERTMLQDIDIQLNSGMSFTDILKQLDDALEKANDRLQSQGIVYVERIRNPENVARDESPDVIRAQARERLAELQQEVALLNDQKIFFESLLVSRKGKATQKGGDRPVKRLSPSERRRINRVISQRMVQNRLRMAALNERFTEQQLSRITELRTTRPAALEQAAREATRAADDYFEWRVLSDEYAERYFRALENDKLMAAAFIRHDPPSNPTRPVGALQREPGLATPREQLNTMYLAERGDVDRSWDALERTYLRAIEAEKNMNLTKWVLMNGTFAATLNGMMRNSVRKDEFEQFAKIYKKQTGRNLFEDFVYIDRQFLSHPEHLGTFLTIDFTDSSLDPRKNVSKSVVSTGEMQKRIDAAVEKGIRDADDGGNQDFAFLSEKGREQLNIFNEKLAARAASAGREYVFVNKSVALMLREQTKQLGGWEKAFYELNKWSSRLVLGTSLSWMLAQPIAEMAALLAQHPIKAWPALIEVRKIRRTDPEALMLLSTIARGTLGVDPAINRRTSLTTVGKANADLQRFLSPKQQRSLAKGVSWLRGTPGYSLINESTRGTFQQVFLDTVQMKSFGQFDRWKGAWIREAGLLAEMDSQVMGWKRAMKAVKGQIDLIEENANRMGRMTRKEQLKFINSDEGIEVGMKLAKMIDDQLGNWTDLRPGIEQTVGNIIFFYPFVRFSLTWMLRTYPRDHPVVWTATNLLGLATASSLERLVQYDPMWPNEWAIAPLYGGEEEDSAPTSYIPISRYSLGGNVGTEMLLSQPAPSDLVYELSMRTMPPLLTQALSGIFGKRDRYGNPIRDANDDYGDPDPGIKTQVGFAIDNLLNLTAHYRMFNQGLSNNTGRELSFQNILDPTTPSVTKERSTLGDDPNQTRDLFRRFGIAGIPMPLHTITTSDKSMWKGRGPAPDSFEITTKGFVENKQEQYSKWAATLSPDYTFKGKETIKHPTSDKEVDFNEWAEDFKRQDKMFREERGQALPRTPYVRALIRRYLDLKGQTPYAAPKEKKAALELYRSYQAIGVKPPEWLTKRIESEDRQNRHSRKMDFFDEYPGAVYPGDKEARTYIQKASTGAAVVGNTKVKTPGAPEHLTNNKTNPKRQEVTNELLTGTRKRLEQMGMRRVDLSDPTIDPETKVNKKGNVTKYRGAEVVGYQTVAQVKQAERAGLLERDGKGRLTTPPVRQLIASVENASAATTELRRKLTKASNRGGMPANVPAEYAPWIRKFAPAIDKQARQAYGLSGIEFVAKMLQGESGFDMSRVGPDTPYGNAKGAAQFIPSTRDAFVEKFGLDPWRSVKEAVQAMVLHLDGKSYSKTFGIQGYNPGINDSYYLEQDVGKMQQAKNFDPAKVKQFKAELEAAKKEQNDLLKQAEQQGIPLDMALYDEDTVRELDEPTLWRQPTRVKPGFKGELVDTEGMAPVWEGTSKEVLRLGKTISRWVGHPLGMNSLHRPGDDGDHGTGNALDIHALARQEGGSLEDERKGDRIAAAAVRAVGGTPEQEQQIVNGAALTIDSPNGYRVQIIWKNDTGGNHWNHVHIGIAPSGDIVKPFSKTGRSVPYAQAGAVSGGGGGGGGGGSVSSGGGGGGGGGTPTLEQNIARMERMQMGGDGVPYEGGGVDPGVTAMAKTASGEPKDGVKSVTEAMASLPSVGSKNKKKVPRFSPSNRI